MPGKKALARNEEEIKSLVELVKDAKSLVLADYRGISVSDVSAMRAELRKENIEYRVAKNTLLKRAVEGTEYAGIAEYLEGPTAIAISKDDETAPARILADYAKKVETFSIKGGWIDGNAADAATMNEIAKIPSKEVLIARVLGGFNGPVRSLAYVLQAIVDKKNEEVA